MKRIKFFSGKPAPTTPAVPAKGCWRFLFKELKDRVVVGERWVEVADAGQSESEAMNAAVAQLEGGKTWEYDQRFQKAVRSKE